MSVRLAGTLMGGAVLGKGLGFLREIEMARLVGASIVSDSFRGALTAVLLPVAPIQSDSVPSVLIPLHRGWAAEGDAAPRSTALAFIVTLLGVAVAVLVSALAAPWVGVLVGRFDAAATALTIHFVQVMSLALPASTLSSVLGSVEIALGKSRIAAVRASVQNLGMMAGIAAMAWTGDPAAIAWGFVISFNLVAAFGVVVLAREGAITFRGVRPAVIAEVGLAFWRRFRPLLGIPVAEQGNILLERMLASGLAVGALASLDYARTLTETAFYLISQPIGYVVLTRAAGRVGETRGEVERVSRPLLAVGVPMSAFIVLFATDIVTVVFARGAFDTHAVRLTAGAMGGIAAGLWAAMLGWVLVRLLNAAGRHAMSAVIVVSAFGSNALFNAVAVPWLSPAELGVTGLGLGEAVRGLVLLGGSAVALGCAGPVLRNLGQAVAITAPVAFAGWLILHGTEGSLRHLALAAPLFGAAIATWLVVLLPEQRRRLATTLRRPLRVAPRG